MCESNLIDRSPSKVGALQSKVAQKYKEYFQAEIPERTFPKKIPGTKFIHYVEFDESIYPGGKGSHGVFQTIINKIIPHKTFASMCLGNCRIRKYMFPSELSVGFDPDKKVIDSWLNAKYPTDLLSLENMILKQESFFNVKKYIKEWKDPFLYFDPTYHPDTLTHKYSKYNYTLTKSDHKKMLRLVKSIDAPIAISTYPCTLYDRELKNWNMISYQASTRGGMREEQLWMNYPEPIKLQDYTFLGENSDVREKFKEKLDRWELKFNKLTEIERNAFFSRFNK